MNHTPAPAAAWLPGVIAARAGQDTPAAAAWLADLADAREEDPAYWEQFRARLEAPEPEPRRVRAAALAVLRTTARIVTAAASVVRRDRRAPAKRGQINANG